MNRADAYSILSRKIAEFSESGYQRLVLKVGNPPVTSEAVIDGETVTLETRIRWNDANQSDLRIEVTAFGPSTWRLERLDESIVLKRDAPSV